MHASRPYSRIPYSVFPYLAPFWLPLGKASTVRKDLEPARVDDGAQKGGKEEEIILPLPVPHLVVTKEFKRTTD